ncbi:uncharacterized protein LOC109118070 [Fukomys damarensis]|uniref:uncharacterized protein LOC109118070 n=1 Tax=Fukomys damarensis TaxID=885580 RepID=UPI0008FEB59A|nr:uncharacterized protein LOC109118070 [Fukomys damarensis]
MPHSVAEGSLAGPLPCSKGWRRRGWEQTPRVAGEELGPRGGPGGCLSLPLPLSEPAHFSWPQPLFLRPGVFFPVTISCLSLLSSSHNPSCPASLALSPHCSSPSSLGHLPQGAAGGGDPGSGNTAESEGSKSCASPREERRCGRRGGASSAQWLTSTPPGDYQSLAWALQAQESTESLAQSAAPSCVRGPCPWLPGVRPGPPACKKFPGRPLRVGPSVQRRSQMKHVCERTGRRPLGERERQPPRKAAWRVLRKPKGEVPSHPAVPLLRISLKELRTPCCSDPSPPGFTAAPLIRAKSWKWPLCPSAEEWTKCGIYTWWDTTLS